MDRKMTEDRDDSSKMADALSDVNAAWMKDEEAFRRCCRALGKNLQSTHAKVLTHLQSLPENPADDGESGLVQWVGEMAWSSQQYHRVWSDWLSDCVDLAPELPDASRRQARFWINQVQTMLEPTHWFWTNPKAVQRFVQTRGESLSQGLRNWLDDATDRHGLVCLSDPESFTLGKDLAATKGSVIFRNELMELIQYAPQTETVRRVPIVLIQPWINKYYIFDLSARNSFVSYLVRQGYTVFITSWKNPGPELRHLTFEDYMIKGALQAVRISRDVCKAPRVHLAGYCIGGTLITTLMGWLAQDRTDSTVADVTLFSTLVDFSQPGDIGSLLQPEIIDAVEERMAECGILGERQIAAAFRMLNPKDLIWRYVVHNYFLGERPPKSDMLYWNSDGTNLPQAMCRFYLKTFYQENRIIIPGALQIGGRAIDLGRVQIPFYVVGSAKDHICPWRSTFRTCGLVGGKVRFVLADEGHITGIVNPPSKWSKKKYWAAAATRRRDADKWLEKQTPEQGSWWPDWVRWLGRRSGPRVQPPGMGSRSHTPLCPAPGTYVMESSRGRS
jgi:polyhydroxyalkanoate synthase